MWHARGRREMRISGNRILERNSLLERPECRWVNNIKMYYKEIGCEDVDWIYQVASPCVHVNEPLVFIKCSEYLDQLRNYKLINKEPKRCLKQ
jgi:hypothetical protein